MTAPSSHVMYALYQSRPKETIKNLRKRTYESNSVLKQTGTTDDNATAIARYLNYSFNHYIAIKQSCSCLSFRI